MLFDRLMQILMYDDEEAGADDAARAIDQHRHELQEECIEYVRQIKDIEGLTELREALVEYFLDGGD